MSGHGGNGFSIAQLLRAKSLHLEALPTDSVVPTEDLPLKIEGFRHFLCEADTLPPDKQFKVYGEDPLKDVPRLGELMKRLSVRMNKPPKWEKAAGSSASDENPEIPAGYTYLLQLIAHDLVQTNFSLSILGGEALGVRNDRAYRLTLDTIYGGGPDACPFAYAHDPVRGTRSRLCLGGGEATDTFPEMKPKGRDIGRSYRNFSTASAKHGLTEVLIADPRNDDHAILAQLTALFHQLHNGLVGKLERRFAGKTDFSVKSAFERFLCARGAVTLIYRNIIRCDVMEKLLHPVIYDRYNVRNPPFLDRSCVQPRPGESDALRATRLPDRGSFIPLEFTHGAFRFGHAMARKIYRFNAVPAHEFGLDEALRANSLKRALDMPLDHRWIVDWSFFFLLPNEENRHCQLSRRISPNYVEGFNDPDLFPAIDDSNETGVAYRDLISASCAGMWSVDSLIEEIRERCPCIVKASKLLDDRCYRTERLREWLQWHPGIFEKCDIETLATDPPLPFFILFEAATEPKDDPKQGTRLGVLGSVIVAEVIFGALAGDQLPAEKGANSLRESLSMLSQSLLQADCFEDFTDVKTMGQLVEYTATVANLVDADPPFL